MIVDTSAILAVLYEEAGFEDIVRKLARASSVGIGAPAVAETAIVMTARLDSGARGLVKRVLLDFGMVVVPFGDEHGIEAEDAYRRYGKGRHLARLNLGDCMSYATAKPAGRPLLCVGDDFRRTDLEIG